MTGTDDLIDPPENAPSAPPPMQFPPPGVSLPPALAPSPENFELTSPVAGAIAPEVIAELRRCYAEAKDYAGAFSDAVKAQAEKHKFRPAALRRYIAALEGDKLDEAKAEAEDLERLIEKGTL